MLSTIRSVVVTKAGKIILDSSKLFLCCTIFGRIVVDCCFAVMMGFLVVVFCTVVALVVVVLLVVVALVVVVLLVVVVTKAGTIGAEVLPGNWTPIS